MGVPGYAAEAGLNRSTNPYRGAYRSSGSPDMTVVPQQTCQNSCLVQYPRLAASRSWRSHFPFDWNQTNQE
jgi:hypothetical protein